jgi:zinc protease
MRILTVVGLLIAACLAAQEKEAPPALGTPKPFVLPRSDTFSLKNGMQVTLAEYGAVPIATVNATIAFGRANETADQVWLANLTTELMTEGTQRMDAAQLANAAAQMGGQLNVSAGTDESSASIDVLGEFTGDAVKLIADVLEHPRLPASELERVRGNLLRRVTVQLSTPGASEPGIRRSPFSRTRLWQAVSHRKPVERVRDRGRAEILRG